MSDTYLIKAADIDAMKGVAKTHFLNENAQRINKSLGDVTGLTGFGFHIIEVAPGHDSTEHHVHHHEDECIYVLSGTATAYLDDAAHEIGAGDFIGYRKGGLPHSITNTGSEMFRCIVVGQRLPHDVGDYTKLGKRIYRNEGQPWALVDHENVKEIGGGVGKK